MRNRIISTILIAIILVIANSNTVSAHPNSQKGILAESYFSVENYHGYFVGGEEVGWALAEDNHTNGTTLTYYFAQNNDNLTNAMKNYTQAGATWWNGVVTITRITEAQIDADPTICNPDYYPSGIGVITTDSLSSTSRFAEFRPTNVDSLGHLKEWSIAINVNTASNLNAKIMAHEFGHAIGLTDLYSLDNRDKLMYGYPNSGTATSLNALDIWGTKVITGTHTSHTWDYKYYDTDNQGNIHIKYCTQCRGLSVISGHCVYNSKDICITCGVPRGAQISELEEKKEIE